MLVAMRRASEWYGEKAFDCKIGFASRVAQYGHGTIFMYLYRASHMKKALSFVMDVKSSGHEP